LTRGAGETFNFVVPIRRMRVWASHTGVLFALDDSVPVPDAATLARMPVEDVGRDFKAGRASTANSSPASSLTHTWLYKKPAPKVYGPPTPRRDK